MTEEFRIVTLDSKVSEELFSTVRASDNKNRIVVESESGARLTIHKRRVIGVDSLGKAVALHRGSLSKAVCPKCSNVIDVVNDMIICPVHGEFETTSHGQKPRSVKTIRRLKLQQDKEKPMSQQTTESQATESQVTTEAVDKIATDEATDTTIGIVVDMEEIKKFGEELWTKTQLNFDHVAMDVKAHVLLANEPCRKLCFNTYDGTLGKKKKFEDLCLEDFKTNTTVKSKKLWHLLKGTLDDARQHLEKKGYARV